MELETTLAFVKVAQLGSFTRAGMALRLPKSTISRLVSRLEEETGTTLLVRTTRSLSLTAAGRAFYDTCVAPLQHLEDARKSLQGKDSILSGMLRITAPEDLGTFYLSPAMGKLALRHPELQFEFSYTNVTVDLVKEGFDLAIRIGRLNPSQFRAKRLGEILVAPVAAPSYLKSAPRIKAPSDLGSHSCLSLTANLAQPRWQLRSGKRTDTVLVHPRIVGNQMTSLVRLALDGVGVALVPLYLCRKYLDSGRLERVLPAWVGPRYEVSLVTPLKSGTSARLKLVSDFLADTVRQAIGAAE